MLLPLEVKARGSGSVQWPKTFFSPIPFRPFVLWLPFIGPVVVMSKKHKDDERNKRRIYAHEGSHINQIRRLRAEKGKVRGVVLFYWRWFTDKHWRLEYEGAAFAKDCEFWWNLGVYKFGEVTVLDHYALVIKDSYFFDHSFMMCRAVIVKNLSREVPEGQRVLKHIEGNMEEGVDFLRGSKKGFSLLV